MSGSDSLAKVTPGGLFNGRGQMQFELPYVNPRSGSRRRNGYLTWVKDS